ELDYSVQDNVIRVFRRRVVTRIFDINYVITRRTGSRSLTASSSATGGSVTAVGTIGVVATTDMGSGSGGNSAQVNGNDGGDFFAEFDTGLKTLLSADARYNLDRKAGLLQVTDYPDRLDKIGLYLEAVQTRVNRQVQIEAKVIEVELSSTFAAGLNW